MKYIVAVSMILALTACEPKQSVDPNVEQLGRATGPTMPQMKPGAMMPPPGAAQKVHEGKILEVINVPRYTYIRFQGADSKELWAAVPTSQVEVGQEVKIAEQMVQKEFASPSLNRTFDTLIFGTIGGEEGDAKATGDLPPGHPPIEGADKPTADAKALPPGHPPVDAKAEKK